MPRRSRMRRSSIPKIIRTVGGSARLVKVEVEDKLGRWNDIYSTRDGYWVIHKGNKHYVYRVM